MGTHLKGLDVILDFEQDGILLYRAMEENACIHLEEVGVWFKYMNEDHDKNVAGTIMSLLAQGESTRPHAT